MNTISALSKNILAALVIVWTIQTLYWGVYMGCFSWGIENYPSSLWAGFFGGWVEFSDSYLFIGEYAQAILRVIANYPHEAIALIVIGVLYELAMWEAE